MSSSEGKASTALANKFFYASSACIYPEFKQLETNVSLKEADAWPAEPQDAYGLEKLAIEELYKHYTKTSASSARLGGSITCMDPLEHGKVGVCLD
ncbi:GDP-mannose 3,5-epimerase 1-like [Iris pallida]|uniref:GDP-mannose 3,5-epimerase 1-like n=1 Tax=Iris pallida TaxID=29817 RepID=A0AAX6DSW1_IRIPA|nr:GDP-mannose 3,5-epimerase 1-like [Iris pallida]KAJ6809135.1 GDP-mannose 3,5-epimerase 1-like [Iris pallida]